MNPETTAYPLSWPLARPRTKTREVARFASTTKSMARRPVSVAEAVQRLLLELNRYTRPGHDWRVPPGLTVISTNVPTRQDGLPRAGLSEPSDPGAAVYFQLDGVPYCLPCDKYTRVADNLAAIAAHIEASRGIERWGVGSSNDIYAGFLALPETAGPSTAGTWWDVLRVSHTASPEEINAAFRRLARTAHPDAGGSTEQMAALNEARAQGMKQNAS